MDDRRRTITSEEQIGEALMRVSNTLEAQRLTKSLEYQEKVRKRTAFRTVLSIILAIALIMLLIVGGLLLFVLKKYMDPILERVLPFFDTVLHDLTTIWKALVESSTYVPEFLEKFSTMMDEMIVSMRNINGLPLESLLENINNLLATTNGLMLGTTAMLSSVADSLGTFSEGMRPLLNGLAEGMGSFGSSLSDMGSTLGDIGSSFGSSLSNVGSTLGEIGGSVGSSFSNIGDSLGDMGSSVGSMLNDFAKAGSITASVAADTMQMFANVMKNIDFESLTKAISKVIGELPNIIDKSSNALINGIDTLDKINAELAKNSDQISEVIKNTVEASKSFSEAMAKLGNFLDNLPGKK